MRQCGEREREKERSRKREVQTGCTDLSVEGQVSIPLKVVTALTSDNSLGTLPTSTVLSLAEAMREIAPWRCREVTLLCLRERERKKRVCWLCAISRGGRKEVRAVAPFNIEI